MTRISYSKFIQVYISGLLICIASSYLLEKFTGVHFFNIGGSVATISAILIIPNFRAISISGDKIEFFYLIGLHHTIALKNIEKAALNGNSLVLQVSNNSNKGMRYNLFFFEEESKKTIIKSLDDQLSKLNKPGSGQLNS